MNNEGREFECKNCEKLFLALENLNQLVVCSCGVAIVGGRGSNKDKKTYKYVDASPPLKTVTAKPPMRG